MILDTNAVSALLAGEARLEERLGAADRLYLPIFVIGEYRFGLLGSRFRDSLEPLFARLDEACHTLCPNEQTARQYATVRHELRTKGQPIPENDVWIAALARQHDMALVTRDTHFDQVDGLTRISW